MLQKFVLPSACLLAALACKPQVDSVAITPDAVALGAAGEAKELKATAKDKDGKDIPEQPFTWSTSNGAVAAVGAEGRVVAKADGEAVITAKTGEKSGTAKVTVIIPTTVELVPAALTLKTGGAPEKLSARVLSGKGQVMAGKAITWTSDKDTVATVAEDGMVTPTGVGTATVTAKADKLSGSATVIVTEAAPPVEEPAPAPAPPPRPKKGKK